MTYQIVRHGAGDYAVLDVEAGLLVLERETMGICDGFVYAHTRPASELAELRRVYEEGKGKP